MKFNPKVLQNKLIISVLKSSKFNVNGYIYIHIDSP